LSLNIPIFFLNELKLSVKACSADFIAHQKPADELLDSEKTYSCEQRSICEMLINVEQENCGNEYHYVVETSNNGKDNERMSCVHKFLFQVSEAEHLEQNGKDKADSNQHHSADPSALLLTVLTCIQAILEGKLGLGDRQYDDIHKVKNY
jgi:hypothetical protein